MSWLFPAAVFLLAGFVKGVIGLGLPAIGVGLLGLVMAPAQAASLLVMPSTVTNAWQLVAGPGFWPIVRRLWPMLAAIVAGVWLGSGALTSDGTGRGRFLLGVLLALYGLYGLLGRPPAVPGRWEIWLGPLTGLLTGLITATTGAFTLPMVPYLGGLGLDREELVQAMGLSFTVCTLALAVDLAHSGAFDLAVLARSTVAVVPSLIGMFVGQAVRNRLSPVLFRRCFFAGMLVLGLELLRH